MRITYYVLREAGRRPRARAIQSPKPIRRRCAMARQEVQSRAGGGIAEGSGVRASAFASFGATRRECPYLFTYVRICSLIFAYIRIIRKNIPGQGVRGGANCVRTSEFAASFKVRRWMSPRRIKPDRTGSKLIQGTRVGGRGRSQDLQCDSCTARKICKLKHLFDRYGQLFHCGVRNFATLQTHICANGQKLRVCPGEVRLSKPRIPKKSIGVKPN